MFRGYLKKETSGQLSWRSAAYQINCKLRMKGFGEICDLPGLTVDPYCNPFCVSFTAQCIFPLQPPVLTFVPNVLK
jgi:hypothetical protein